MMTMEEAKAFAIILFDVDLTLRRPIIGEKFPKTLTDWHVYPQRLERCHALVQAGIPIGLVTNQGGVAFGIYQPGDIMKELYLLAHTVHASTVKVCFNHPKGKTAPWNTESPRRKPGGKMIVEAVEDISLVYMMSVPLSMVLYVGDMPEDAEAARDAGVAFCATDDFF